MALTRSTVAAMAAGAVLTLGVGGAAVALGTSALADSSPSPSATSGAPGGAQEQRTGPGFGPGHRGGGMGRMMGGNVLHGEVVVQDGAGSATKKILVQQGSVTAKTGSTVTIKSTDGFTVTWTVGSSTRGSSLADLAIGDQAHAAGAKTADGAATADMIHERGSRPDRPKGQIS